MVVKGIVSQKPFSPGSKSDHLAVVLRTDGADYVLRRVGANPFFDPVMNELVGRTVEVEGYVEGYALFIRSWHEIERS